MSRATWYRKGKPVPEGRETTFGIQQVLAAPCCIPSAVLTVCGPKRGCPKEDHPSQAISIPNTLPVEAKAGFQVMPWYPAHIQAQARDGWWSPKRCEP